MWSHLQPHLQPGGPGGDEGAAAQTFLFAPPLASLWVCSPAVDHVYWGAGAPAWFLGVFLRGEGGFVDGGGPEAAQRRGRNTPHLPLMPPEYLSIFLRINVSFCINPILEREKKQASYITRTAKLLLIMVLMTPPNPPTYTRVHTHLSLKWKATNVPFMDVLLKDLPTRLSIWWRGSFVPVATWGTAVKNLARKNRNSLPINHQYLPK